VLESVIQIITIVTSAMDNNNCEQCVYERSVEEIQYSVICVYLTVLPADPSSGKCKHYTPYTSLLLTPLCCTSMRKVSFVSR
jgi:hypothetical protein